jgi:hypothetical protein
VHSMDNIKVSQKNINCIITTRMSLICELQSNLIVIFFIKVAVRDILRFSSLLVTAQEHCSLISGRGVTVNATAIPYKHHC